MNRTAKRLSAVNEYYFSHKLRAVRQMIADGKPVINMGIGSPDLAPAPAVTDALQNALQDGGAHQYQSYQGLPELRQAMADFYKMQFDVLLHPGHEVLPLMGSKEGIMHLCMAFLDRGDQVLLPNPGYPTYTSVAHLVGAEAVHYELLAENDWQPDFEALEKLDMSRVKIMWVNYPHMPTGARGSLALFEKLVAFAQTHGILLVNDNPYSFVLNDDPISILQVQGAKAVAVELNSLSKTFNLAGWRVGMMLGSADILEAVIKVKSNFDSGMFYGIQKGAIAALQSGPEWFAKQNEIYRQRRELVFALADLLGCTCDRKTVGLFVWAKLPPGAVSSEAFIDKMLEQQNIFIAPGTIFGSLGEGYIRFSLCVEAAKINEAIERFNKKK